MTGFDPDPANARARGRARRARRGARARSPRRSTGAEVVFCAAPVGALPALVAEALAASDADDGGHRRRLDQAGADRGRSPDDAEADRGSSAATRWPAPRPSGVENARAELLEGARWYLTPTEAVERPALRPPAAHGRRARRPAAGDRRRDPRPGDGDGQPPAARARQRARPAGGGGALGGVRAPARGRDELSRHDPGRRREPGDLGRHLRHQPRCGRGRDRRGRRAAARGRGADPRRRRRRGRRVAPRRGARTGAGCSSPT